LQIPVAASMTVSGASNTLIRSARIVARGGHYQATRHASADVLLSLCAVRRPHLELVDSVLLHHPADAAHPRRHRSDEIGRNVSVALGLMADIRTFCGKFLAKLIAAKDLTKKPRPARSGSADRRLSQNGQTGCAGLHRSTPAINRSARHSKSKGDCPTTRSWSRHWRAPQLAARLLQARRPDPRSSSCMGFGSMGFGVAGVMGREVRGDDRPCVSVCGDGAFFMQAKRCSVPRSNIICVRLGGVEQLRLCLDPRFAARLSEQTRNWRRTSRSLTGQRYNPTLPRWRVPAVSKACASTAPPYRRGDQEGHCPNKPYLIDVDIAADINPAGAGVWELPGLGVSKPSSASSSYPADIALVHQVSRCTFSHRERSRAQRAGEGFLVYRNI